ncbi:hypothetical protein DEU56DRAFT_757939 [Suillus clintonianus]|uniref:uncharacterized protein n=1 Tax=Suillus clintonianus TaxID=1904413 RepID=UPI001B882675|nr:uncharacterized protein DEU56DRAFT_757939 [Suillus clintonianus]KAG2130268.1 hypothetical protein DEU56DRAFT_757939 [Suillus clintonianus]
MTRYTLCSLNASAQGHNLLGHYPKGTYNLQLLDKRRSPEPTPMPSVNTLRLLRRYGTYFRHGGTLPDINLVSLTWWTVVVRWKIVSFPLGPEIANLNFDVAVVDVSRSIINCCSTLSLSLRWSNFSDGPGGVLVGTTVRSEIIGATITVRPAKTLIQGSKTKL